MSAQSIEGLWLCLAFTLMALTVAPLLAWGPGGHKA